MSSGRERFRGVQPNGFVRAVEVGHQSALGVEPLGDVLDRHHHADDRIAVRQRRGRDVLAHVLEPRRALSRRARDEIFVKGGREHFDAGSLRHATQACEQSALD